MFETLYLLFEAAEEFFDNMYGNIYYDYYEENRDEE